MNAVTAIHKQHAATKQRLTRDRDEKADALSNHDRTSAAKAAQLAKIEAAYVDNATAEALGLEMPHELPAANVLEKLRADVAVAAPVRLQLAANLDRCESALKAAESTHKDAIGDHLRTTVMPPALAELEQAFAAVRDAAVNVMAAHRLAYHDFSERKPPYHNANDISGPAAQWLATLQTADWPDYPYSIRPDWLPQYGRFWPDELAGVWDRMKQLRAEVEQVPA